MWNGAKYERRKAGRIQHPPPFKDRVTVLICKTGIERPAPQRGSDFRGQSFWSCAMAWHASNYLSAGNRNIRSWLIQAGIVFIAYYLAGKLGQASAERSSNLGPLWPAFGIALAALLRLGNRMLPVVAAAAFLVASQSPVPLVV